MVKPLTGSGQVHRMVLKGFKSLDQCDIELGALNVLIGSNGAGKSNFITFFKMIQQMLEERLQIFVSHQGGPDSILHFGRKTTEKLSAELYFGNNGYKMVLSPTSDNRLMFEDEAFWWNVNGDWSLGSGHFETNVKKGTRTRIDRYVTPYIKQWRVYHFHDTSDTALVKQMQNIGDNEYLRPDARNLAAFLYMLKQTRFEYYQRIIKAVRLVAPFFGDFNLRPSPLNEAMIELEWVEKGSDMPFKASHLSDGTLRFICLATVMLQPNSFQPATILVDEPELGLHPYAIGVLGSMIKMASKQKQLIISTQSADLLTEFDAEDVIVVNLNQGKSVFKRLEQDALTEWLSEYTLGDLWKKNLLGGRPSR